MSNSEHAGLAILVEELKKDFGDVHALRGVNFAVPRGTVLGLLGPNGAGKTTAVRILTTLLEPSGGRAFVEGHDVVREADAVRRLIGLAGQSAAIQEELTGRENLEIIGRLHHLGKANAKSRAVELLERFDLMDVADRRAKGFSGGMQRRLDLAASLIGRPEILFLDEPTNGLDPRSRLSVWEMIRDLVAQGTTLLLTTQNLDEVDELANQIVVIDHGKVIAVGTASELKNSIGGDVLEFEVTDRTQVAVAVEAVAALGAAGIQQSESRITLGVGELGSSTLVEVVRRLDQAGVETTDLRLRRPSLDDVFLSVTGHVADDESEGAKSGRPRRRRPSASGSGEST